MLAAQRRRLEREQLDEEEAVLRMRCGAPIPTLGEACYEEGFRLLESLVDVLEQGEIPRHKDKTCSCGRDCIAIGAVKQYLRTKRI